MTVFSFILCHSRSITTNVTEHLLFFFGDDLAIAFILINCSLLNPVVRNFIKINDVLAVNPSLKF